MNGWTEARLARLQRDFHQGLTCAESAERLGVTPVAVRNRRQRSGLRRPRPTPAERPAPASARSATDAAGEAPRRRFQPRFLETPAPAPPEILAEGADLAGCKRLTELGRAECRWPIEATLAETSAATRFCARPVEVRGPYCPAHARAARRGAP